MQQGQQVETITITAQAVYAANAGKKFGAVVDQTNNRYPATPDILSQISKGQTVTVEIGHQNWGGKPVQVINRILDAAPRVHGTQAPEQPDSLDVSSRMFAYNFMAALYHGLGNFPGAEVLQEQLYAARCAYHTAYSRQVRILTPRSAPASQSPRREQWQGDHPDDIPP